MKENVMQNKTVIIRVLKNGKTGHLSINKMPNHFKNPEANKLQSLLNFKRG